MSRFVSGPNVAPTPNRIKANSFIGGTSLTACVWHYQVGSVTVDTSQAIIVDDGGVAGFNLASVSNYPTVPYMQCDLVGAAFIHTTTIYPSQTWAHTAFTTDGTHNTLWLNASVVGGVTATYVAASAGTFNIADNSPHGYFADAAVWNVALTQNELIALVNGARPGSIRPLNLILWWPLDGLSGSSVEPDLSGNQNSALLTNTTGNPQFGPPVMPFTPRRPNTTPFTLPPPPPANPYGGVGNSIFRTRSEGWRWRKPKPKIILPGSELWR